MIMTYALLWFGMLVLAILNGAVRVEWYESSMSELTAHQVSTITGIVIIGIYIWAVGLRWKIPSRRQALQIGLLWVAMTVAFEFLFGHYVMKHPWSRLLQDYHILEGRIWVLMLLWTGIAPMVFYRQREGKGK